MFVYFMAILFISISFLLYKRYIPVFGVPCREVTEGHLTNNDILLDIRDYTIASKNPVNGSFSIPAPYLNRYMSEIPGKHVHLVASDRLEKNWAIRVLRKNGYHVVGYSLAGCGCQ
ncbi:sulfurtransferase [Neobacillus notoginsengisoli]|uniref:Sulfurtransferase n=1 Tax=Neobacillus notoginsengisoli TaxID=1578198 RepID=A0A417YWT0_9BACI|nr:sulfurtransferase [Neobacillus notoginsengisoli]RHW41701.1 sulfurtransferase [Neobacillus notoginsengisoli]